jgi:hypothetical protein
MSKGLQAVKETDVIKALRAALKAGMEVQRFEVDRAGRIVVIAGRSLDDRTATALAG